MYKNIFMGFLFAWIVIIYVQKNNLVTPSQTPINQIDNSTTQTTEIMQQLKKLQQSVQDLNKRIIYLESGSITSKKIIKPSNFAKEVVRPSVDFDSIQLLVDKAKIQNEKSIAAFQNQLEEEQIDSEWTGKAEQSIQSVIANFPDFSDTPIECKSSICRLEVYYDKTRNVSKFLKKLALKTGNILPLMNTQYLTENEQRKVIVFLSERNER